MKYCKVRETSCVQTFPQLCSRDRSRENITQLKFNIPKFMQSLKRPHDIRNKSKESSLNGSVANVDTHRPRSVLFLQPYTTREAYNFGRRLHKFTTCVSSIYLDSKKNEFQLSCSDICGAVMYSNKGKTYCVSFHVTYIYFLSSKGLTKPMLSKLKFSKLLYWLCTVLGLCGSLSLAFLVFIFSVQCTFVQLLFIRFSLFLWTSYCLSFDQAASAGYPLISSNFSWVD